MIYCIVKPNFFTFSISSATFDPTVVNKSPTMAALMPAPMASSSICAINFLPPAKRKYALGWINRKTAIVVRTSSSERGGMFSKGVPGMGLNTFNGMEVIPKSRNNNAMSIRSCMLSPMPIIPPEQTSMPISRAARIVAIFSSVVCVVHKLGKYCADVSRLQW